MNNNVFCNNLKKLRSQKNLTQENVADILGVNTQTVSRWECGTSLPDIMILPEIARIYCVTVDDLYHDTSSAYDNYAQRLADVFMKTRKPDDFLLAHNEFKKLKASGEYYPEDKRIHASILTVMLSFCKKQALICINDVISDFEKQNNILPENKTYWRTRCQKTIYYHALENSQCICDEQLKKLEKNPENYMEYAVTIHAFRYGGFYEKAYEYFKIANEKFPDNWEILVNGAEVCKDIKKYEEAIKCCDIANSLPEAKNFLDQQYTKAFCLEGLGEYNKALSIWKEIITSLNKDGYEHDVEKRFMQNCVDKMNNTP